MLCRLAPKSCSPWRGKSAKDFFDIWSTGQQTPQITTAKIESLESSGAASKDTSHTHFNALNFLVHQFQVDWEDLFITQSLA